ncbi:MAG: autotransporter outer membrane beta-barrel domain-containing protein, partial [Thermoguttaceae bacterium]|nr:autotransporter outer membrane beta-barrel domain-containing protein [Thermoguttaceae bacterium]
NMSNFQLGLYGGTSFMSGWEAKLYVGGGAQDYTSKRKLALGSVENYQTAQYDGKSFAAALQLGRPLAMNEFALLRPVVQFDYEHVWQDGAVEKGAGTALKFEKNNWSRAFARFGAEYEWNAPFVLFNARALYGIQMGGDDAPTSEFSFAGFSGGKTVSVAGLEQGKSFVDLGVGANGYLDCERHWIVGGNYDYVVSDKTRSHVGTVGLSYVF